MMMMFPTKHFDITRDVVDALVAEIKTKERSPCASTRFTLIMENERGLTRDGAAESVSRDQFSGVNKDTSKII